MNTVNNLSEKQKMHHYMGIEMNIQIWNLLNNKNHSEQDGKRMVMFAKASLFHWKLSPKFQPINEQRGEWMISHVYSVLGNGKEALDHAKIAWSLTKKHKFNGFDLAYAHECLSRAYAASGNNLKCKSWYKKAEQCGDLISDTKDKEIFFGDLNKDPWYDCLT